MVYSLFYNSLASNTTNTQLHTLSFITLPTPQTATQGHESSFGGGCEWCATWHDDAVIENNKVLHHQRCLKIIFSLLLLQCVSVNRILHTLLNLQIDAHVVYPYHIYDAMTSVTSQNLI